MKAFHGKRRLTKKLFKRFVTRDKNAFNMYWKYFSEHKIPTVGEITHDCTGENHVITKVNIQWVGTKRVRIAVLDVEYGNGHRVCPCCGMGFQPPAPRQQVENSLLAWAKIEDEDFPNERAKAFADGTAFIDEFGVYKLKENKNAITK